VAIVLVQTNMGAANAATATATFAATATSGNTLVAFGYTNGNAGTLSITGWTKTIDLAYSGTGQSIAFFSKISNGTETGITLNGNTITRLHIAEFSGLLAAVTTDGSNTNTLNTTTTISTNGVTTANANDLLLVAGGTSAGASGARSWSNSFSVLTDDAASPRLLSGYQIVSATGSYSSTATLNSVTTNCGAFIIALQAASAATAVPPGPSMPYVVPFLT
jgi:hypothetical protein